MPGTVAQTTGEESEWTRIAALSGHGSASYPLGSSWPLRSPRGGRCARPAGRGWLVTGLKLTRLVIAGTKATISGTGITNGLKTVEFQVEINDLSRDGKTDTVTLRWPGYTVSSVIKLGDNEVPCR